MNIIAACMIAYFVCLALLLVFNYGAHYGDRDE